MVKRFKYDCDGGCIVLGNETFRVHFPNNYGDGRFDVTIANEDENAWSMAVDWNYRGTLEGSNIHIYRYDCFHGDELIKKKNIAYTLPDGAWSVYAKSGNILIIQR